MSAFPANDQVSTWVTCSECKRRRFCERENFVCRSCLCMVPAPETDLDRARPAPRSKP